ncbi:MAG: protease modulator HflC, partial [Pseudoalteromonas rhizosphaerae]
VEEIRGLADAKAAAIYADAYNQNAQAVAFYAFIRSLQAYELVLNDNTTLVLSTDSELFKYLKNTDTQPIPGNN